MKYHLVFLFPCMLALISAKRMKKVLKKPVENKKVRVNYSIKKYRNRIKEKQGEE